MSLESKSASSLTTFPVPLVCPNCGDNLIPEQVCGCPAHTALEIWQGVPRILFGQKYWGECSSEELRAVLDRMETMSWQQALRAVLGGKPVYKHLTSRIAADFIYSLPWDEISDVLDIGAGMGFVTVPMSRFAKRVVAVEAVPERAQFLARRAAQEGLCNVHPIIATATSLPFSPESFDLITLNGVFEYIGLWGEGDPQHVQLDFLKTVRRLLRPTGILYIGIETRFGLANWLGSRDHSGFKYTSLMPRRLANAYCRWRRRPFYGSETATAGYRTYTYTPAQSADLLRRAGFETVEVHGCFPGYNEQRAIYPLKSYAVTREMRRLVYPAASRLGTLRTLLTQRRMLYDKIENEIILLATQRQTSSPLNAASHSSTRASGAQLNTSDKILLIRFADNEPVSIAKAGKDTLTEHRLTIAFDFLSKVYDRAATADLGVRLPRPISQWSRNGLTYFEYEYVRGTRLSDYLTPRVFRLEKFIAILKNTIERYVHFCSWLNKEVPLNMAGRVDTFIDEVCGISVDNSALASNVKEACRRIRNGQFPLSWVHGDLSLSNVLVTNDQLVLIDWENVSGSSLVGIDLIRLLYDTWDETSLLRADLRAKVMKATGHAVSAALETLGVDGGGYRDLESLFLAHQHRFVTDRAINGARAVVTKDVPPDCVVAGSPARVVKRLLDNFA